MKTVLFLLCIILLLSCDRLESPPYYKQENTINNDIIYEGKGKIVGYLKCTDSERKDTLFGIFIISNNEDSLLAFNVPSSVHGLDTARVDDGIYFFNGDSVLFEYRAVKTGEKKQFDCLPSTVQTQGSYAIDNFSRVVVTDISNTSVYPVEVDITNITSDWLDADTTNSSIRGICWNYQITKGHIVYIINSTEELLDYITCNNDDIPEIDFDKYSLLHVRGGATSGIASVSRDLQQTSTNEYKFMIDVDLNYTTAPGAWWLAVLTPKLLSSAVIELDVKQHY